MDSKLIWNLCLWNNRNIIFDSLFFIIKRKNCTKFYILSFLKISNFSVRT